MHRSFFAFAVTLTLCVFHISYAQVVNPDLINFSTISIWPDLKPCVQACFETIGDDVGCSSNACLCRPDVIPIVAEQLFVDAFLSCSAERDQSSATSIFTAYCAAKGYTSSDILSTTESMYQSPVTVTAVPTRTITTYVTVFVQSEAVGLEKQYEKSVIAIAFAFFGTLYNAFR